MKKLAGDIVSELANDEGVVFSVSGLGCDIEHKGEVRYLAPRKAMNEVSGMQCNGFGSCEGKTLAYDIHE